MSKIIYIIGVAGSGKTTIGKLLSQQTGLPFFDADDFHSELNKQKMAAGNPLNDEDRKQWLQQISAEAIKQSQNNGAIIACSALKESYRKILSTCIKPIWIFLQGDYETIYNRMNERNHFMPAKLLNSQFEILELPAFAFAIDINNEPSRIVEIIIQYLNSLNPR